MMKISFSSLGNPKMPLAELADMLHVAGYDAIELRCRPGQHVHWQDTPERRKEVRAILADRNLEAAAVSTYVFMANRDSGGPDKPDTRNEAENIEELKRFVDLASDLGAKNVRVFGGAVSEGETHDDALPRVARIMAAGAKVNPEINIALETHDVWNTGPIVARVLDQAGQPNCKALWDVHGPQHAGEAPQDTLKALKAERVAYLHVKDYFTAPGLEGPYQCLIGAGETPIRKVVQLLKETGWAGYLNVEWEGVYHDYMPDCDVAIPQAIMKLREFLAE